MPENKVIIYTANDDKTKIDVAAQSADILSVVSDLPHLFVFIDFVPKNQSRPLEKSDGSGKFIRQRLFSY